MASDRKQKESNSIPIRFFDEDESRADEAAETGLEEPIVQILDDPLADDDPPAEAPAPGEGGPVLAELVATRAELKRLQTQLSETTEALARRQADFDNYRKRIDRERGETHNRIAADVARKLLPVVDNLARALESEKSVEASESNEFRHFLHGVELISKQLNDVLESLGVTPIEAVGEPFNPHIHEAVVTEPSDQHEPDTVLSEMQRGYRIGDRLLRPSMVKVSARGNAPASDEE